MCELTLGVVVFGLGVTGARISALVFCFHPIHVEGVASIVGRADCLCSVLFLSAVIAYCWSARGGRLSPQVGRSSNQDLSPKGRVDVATEKAGVASGWSASELVWLGSAYVLAVGASLSKEIGVTIYGVLLVVEVAERGWQREQEDVHNAAVTSTDRTSKLGTRHGHGVVGWVHRWQRWADTALEASNDALLLSVSKGSKAAGQYWTLLMKNMLMRGLLCILRPVVSCFESDGVVKLLLSMSSCLRDRKSWVRIVCTLVSLVSLAIVRVRLNGPHALYPWTMLENHVTFLPTFRERALSYAQCQFWYFAKLVYPRYLSFDYGYACIPTIHSLLDVRNVFPVSLYCVSVYCVLQAVLHAQWVVLIGGAMMVLPLVPAMNILFPVGAVLADRLLFVPSTGFCLLVGFAMTHRRLSGYWEWCGGLGDSNPTVEDHIAARVTRDPNSSHHTPAKKGAHINEGLRISVPSPSPSPAPGQSPHNSGSAVVSPVGSRGSPRNEDREWRVYGAILRWCLVPLCVLASVRVVTRNVEWRDEVRLFRSALDVCPLSVKALSNYASLILNDVSRIDNAVLTADLALGLYDEHISALVNVAFAEQVSENYVTAMNHMRHSLEVKFTHGKVSICISGLC